MITQLKIENYKSIRDLTLDVGRVNVLIGENGCGKSNILEAITLAAAAEANKLDNEFLFNRGIRVTEPELMRSAFTKENFEKDIKITINNLLHTLQHDNSIYSTWRYLEYKTHEQFEQLVQESEQFKQRNPITFNPFKSFKITKQYKKFTHQFKEFSLQFSQPFEIKNFIIYSPENTILRNFKEVTPIIPLGDKGEGLLKLLTVTQKEESEVFDDIQETLELFDWYESVEIPNELSPLERKITIKDRYLEMPFDQRSANEGFLLVLFYITLVVSKYTPKIFAIDNIDTSLNPKLCSKLIAELARLAKKYDKQIFLTSHNPAILDGIDLGDDEQRLFVVSRNKQGHTRCKRIDLTNKPRSASDEPLKLSEAFVSGYLGGLPKGF